MTDLRPGWADSLTDVPGVRVGHSTRRGDGWLTGTTVILPSDTAALATVNPVGSAVDPVTGELCSVRFGLGDEFADVAAPGEADVAAARADRNGGRQGTATTIGVVATDATLTRARSARVSGIAHDGMARGLRPVHTMFDGDAVFSLATAERVAPDPLSFFVLLEAAVDCFTRAIGHAMLAAQSSVTTPAAQWRSYRDAFPTAFPLTVPEGANS